MQCIKESSTLRVSPKKEKPSPRIVYRYGKEPALQAAIAAKFLQAEKRREENVLGHILDVAGPAQQPVRQSRDVGRVSLDNPVKSSPPEGRFDRVQAFGLVASIELSDPKFIFNRLGHGYHIRLTMPRKLTEK